VDRVAFELHKDEAVGAGLGRIVDEQLAGALGEVRGATPGKGADRAVHAVRKRFKRVRALLRLMRDELDAGVYERENEALRDAAGTLSDVRDATVLLETLKGLNGCVEEPAYLLARKRLLARRRAIQKRLGGQGVGLDGVAAAIEAARDRVGGWQVAQDGWGAVTGGLKKTYKDARAGFREADVGGEPELFHEWRKRTKALWHQLEVLEPIWPEVMKKLADEAHALADLLGEEHDLSVLREVLDAEALARAEAASPVREAVEARRAELGRRAKEMGERLFAERPGAFVKRLGKYWKAWRGSGAETVARCEAEEVPAPVEEVARAVEVSIMGLDERRTSNIEH